jgi:hypothetical protein
MLAQSVCVEVAASDIEQVSAVSQKSTLSAAPDGGIANFQKNFASSAVN